MLLMGDLCPVLPPLSIQSLLSAVALGRLRPKCSADSAHLFGQETKGHKAFSLGKVYPVLSHALEAKAWVHFRLIWRI